MIVFNVGVEEGGCFWADLDPKSGKYLLVGVESKVLLYNRTTNTLVHSYSGHYGSVSTVAISPDNTLMLSNSNRNICHWDVSTGRLVRKLDGGLMPVTHISLHSDNKCLAANASQDGTVRIWDLRQAKVPAQILSEPKDVVTRVHFRESTVYTSSLDCCLRQYDARQAKLIDDLQAAPITTCDVSKDGSLAVAYLEGKGVSLVDLESGEELKIVHHSTSPILPLCWAGPTDDFIIICDSKGLSIYDVLGSEALREEKDITAANFVAYSHGNVIAAMRNGKVAVLPINS